MDIPWLSAAELRAAYGARSLSPVEVVHALLDRIARLDPVLNAFVTLDAEAALDAARRAEAALFADEPLGALHGVPVTLKDTIDTRGLRTTAGSLLWANRVPDADAVVVERLRAAGAIVLGKTNTPEFALFGRTVNRVAGETCNPWDPARTPAGSSGGSGAAVAAGLGPVSLGTDAGGSIRWPSAFCGLFGLMPSYGMVPKTGCFEGADFGSVFSSIGPMTRTVRDAALTLQAIAGHDPRDPMSSRRAIPDYLAACDAGAGGLAIGWLPPPAGLHREPGVEDHVHAAFRAFAGCGAVLSTVSATPPDAGEAMGGTMVAATGPLRALAADPRARAQLTPYAAAMAAVPPLDAATEHAMWAARRALLPQIEALFDGVDLIATPVTCFPAPLRPADPWAMFVEYDRYIPVAALADIAGLAAAAVPCGLHEGLPVSLMLMARRGREDLVLRAAAAFEQERPWAQLRPPL